MNILKQKYQQNLPIQLRGKSCKPYSQKKSDDFHCKVDAEKRKFCINKILDLSQKKKETINKANINLCEYNLVFKLQQLKKPIFQTVNSILSFKIGNKKDSQSFQRHQKQFSSNSGMKTQDFYKKVEINQKYNYNVNFNSKPDKTSNNNKILQDFQIIDISLASKHKNDNHLRQQNGEIHKLQKKRFKTAIVNSQNEISIEKCQKINEQNIQFDSKSLASKSKSMQRLISNKKLNQKLKSKSKLKENINFYKKNTDVLEQQKNVHTNIKQDKENQLNSHCKNQKLKKKQYPKYEIYSSRSQYHIDRIASKLDNYIKCYINNTKKANNS